MSEQQRNTDSTSVSLLARLKSDDPDAWKRFISLYGPLVLNWCGKSSLQSHDSADISQEVFNSVALSIQKFRKEKKGDTFRGWLWTITSNKINEHYRKSKKYPKAIGGSVAKNWIAELPEKEPAEFDEPQGKGKMSLLMSRCLKLVQNDVNESTWQAFDMTAIRKMNAIEVGEMLDMKPNAVRKAKSRVLARIRQEFEGFIDGKSLD